MNSESNNCCDCKTKCVYGVAILGAFLIAGGLVLAMRHYTQTAPLNANRAAERAAALKELQAADVNALTTVAWIDQGKGLVRLPIADAMNLAVKEWQNPAAAREKLLAREAKASFVPPPPPPKPSAFE